MHVLIAEDNPSNVKVLELLLDRLNHTWESAENGLDAVELFRTGKTFDAVLMDLQMPEMDGLEATRIILSEQKDKAPPVIACTANTFDSDREAAKKAGMVGFLPKPIKLKSLENALNGTTAESIATKPSEDIDWEQFGMVMDGGDPELIEIFDDFCNTVFDSLSQMETFRKESDWAQLASVAHRLRGSLLTFGINGFSKEMQTLELAAENGDLSLPDTWANKITTRFSHIETILRARLP